MSTLAEILATAVELHDAGNLDDADKLYREVLNIDPRQPLVWHNLGLIAQARGNLKGATDFVTQAIQFDGMQPSFHNSLGILLQLQSRPAEAAASYRTAIAIAPRYAEPHCNLGNLLQQQGQFAEARACYRRALNCNADLPEAHFNLGLIAQIQEQWDEAKECYEHAIHARPTYADAYNNLGAVCKHADDLENATRCFSEALKFKPDFAEALNHLGSIFQTQGRWAEAMVCYDQALRILPAYPQAHYRRATMLLAQGELAAGWTEYEWRFACPDFPRLDLAGSRWDGTPLAGRKLLVCAEQGLGDTLQFIRYLPLVTEKYGATTVALQKALIPLLRQSGFTGLVAKGDRSIRYDAWIPLMSLPGLFGTTLETIPAKTPYLFADPALVSHWQEVLGESVALRVGIAWQGRESFGGDRFRSIPLAQFEPLAIPGVELISLQQGFGREQIAAVSGRFAVRDLGPKVDRDRGAFMDTAAIMKSLDLVVTSDSAVAHLAGGLGVEVWTVLPLAPDWRWLTEREDSPWYPAMQLFRQTWFDDWAEVFARMTVTLKARQSQESRSTNE